MVALAIIAAALLGLEYEWRRRGLYTWHHNSEEWYPNGMSPLRRFAHWLCSTGLLMPHWALSYNYVWQPRHKIRLALRARGHRSRLFAIYSALCPISLFGHRICFQPFGVDIRAFGAYWCLHHGQRERGRGWYCYASRDATPSGAHAWYLGPPYDVWKAAQTNAKRRSDDRENRERRFTQPRIVVTNTRE